MKNARYSFQICMMVTMNGFCLVKTICAAVITDMPVLYQKFGDIGYKRFVSCVLPQNVGEHTMISFVPTTGFYKGYKRRLLVSQIDEDVYALFLKEKKGDITQLCQEIYLFHKHANKMDMEIDPAGTMYIAGYEKEREQSKYKDGIVKIMLPMPS